jgi:hypothetical protein
MDKLEEEDIPDLLMLVDFEKAFDTVEWPFIEKKSSDFMAWVNGLNLPTHAASVLSRFTRSPAQTEKQSNILKACLREFLSSPKINVDSSTY